MNANKKLVLRPLGGLGNRMLAIASAYTLSKELGRSLSVIWERDEKLNCPFHLLFKKIPDIKVIERYTKIPLLRKVKRHLSHLAYSKVVQRDPLNQLVARQEVLSELASEQKILIYGAHQFYSIDNLNKLFVPIDTIQEKLAEIQNSFEVQMIGVHIRRTDHSAAKEKSPTKLFIEKIGEELKRSETSQFYLSSDDPEEEKRIIDLFGNRIIKQSKRLDRNSIEGNQGALVDMFCLSHCSKIYGSFYSSFSYTAAQLGGAELITLNSSTSPVDHLRHLRKSK